MRNFTVFLLIFVFLLPGCSDNDLTKAQYYEKGMKFLEKGNSNGAVIAFKKAIEKDQNFFEARYQLALSYITERKYESAERELNKVLRLNPSMKEARLALAKVYVHTGRNDLALKELNKYMQTEKEDAEAFELAAVAYADKENYSKAEDMVNKALSISPERISSKLVRADIFIKRGNFEKAESLVNEILAGGSSNKKVLYLLLRIKKKQQEFEGIIEAYKKILEQNPADKRAELALGVAYLQVEDIDQAEKIAEKMKTENPRRPEGYYLHGLVLFRKKNIDEAIISLQKAVKNDVNPGAHYYLGLCHYLKNDLEQATSEFQRVVDLKPEMIQSRLLLAVTHLKKGRAEDAVRETRNVIERDEENAFAHNLLGSAYMALGEGDAAMEEFDRAIELNPGLVDAHIKKGAFNLISGDKEEAEREFVNAVKIAPDVLNSRIILAQYYIKNKQFENAIKVLSEGLKENPNDAVLYNIMGAAYLGAENMDDAVKYFEQAIESNSDFFLPYFNLARVHLNTNEKDRAKAEYMKVLEIDENNIPALLMMAKIMESEGKDDRALSYYRRAKAQGKSVAYIELAGYYQRKKQPMKAVKTLDEALKNDPDNKNILDMKGRIYFTSKQYGKSLDVFKLMEKLDPDIAARKMAGVYAVRGEYDRAIQKLELLLDKHPGSTEILEQIINLYVRKKDYGNAERNAREIISLKPGSETGYQILADVLLADHRIQEAIDALEKAQELNPGNLKTRIMKGRAYISARDFQMAMSIFEELEKSYPDYAPVYFFQASTLEMIGMQKTAIEKHKKALEISSDYAPSLNNLAYLYSEGYGPLDEALELARKAKKIAPKDGSITDTLGWVMYKMENYEKALKYFIEASHYLPGEPTIRYHLGLVYLKKEMKDRAEEQLKNSIRLGRISDFPYLAEAKKVLENIDRK